MSETLPYEFHVTVEAMSTGIDRFRAITSELGVKAIVLDLGINNESILRDYMTSSTLLLDTDNAAIDEVRRIGDGLANHGFDVIRQKIESAPWHPKAPQQEGEQMPVGCYFESHMAVECTPDQVHELREGVKQTASELPLHISRNAFKPITDGKLTIMATLRDYEVPFERFEEDVAASEARLKELGFGLKKPPIVEFALYDSNTHQDNAWMVR